MNNKLEGSQRDEEESIMVALHLAFSRCRRINTSSVRGTSMIGRSFFLFSFFFVYVVQAHDSTVCSVLLPMQHHHHMRFMTQDNLVHAPTSIPPNALLHQHKHRYSNPTRTHFRVPTLAHPTCLLEQH